MPQTFYFNAPGYAACIMTLARMIRGAAFSSSVLVAGLECPLLLFLLFQLLAFFLFGRIGNLKSTA